MTISVSEYLAHIGRKGGKSKSAAKARASRRNGKKARKKPLKWFIHRDEQGIPQRMFWHG